MFVSTTITLTTEETLVFNFTRILFKLSLVALVTNYAARVCGLSYIYNAGIIIAAGAIL